MIHLDTHVVAWLYAGRTDILAIAARQAIEEHELRVSPMVVLELQYLYEIRRTTARAKMVLEALGREIGLEICDLPFGQVAQAALTESWTGDPFDRIIVAQARARGVELVTKDATIAQHYRKVVWD